jgi:hypothetical protein
MDIVSVLEPGKRLRRSPEALNSLRGLRYPRTATTPVSIWPDARQRLPGRRVMHWQGHANPTLSVGAVDATVSSSHV